MTSTPDDWTLRPGRPADAEALSALALRAKASRGYPDEWLEEWAPSLRFTPETFHQCEVLVADRDDGPVGVIALALDPSAARGEIEHLWVDPRVQGRGVGRRLMEAGFARARATGVRWLRVESDPGARIFYERMGGSQRGEVAAPVSGDPDRTLPVLLIPVPA